MTLVFTCIAATLVGASAKDAFVFLGATGDNALRPAGVWQGLYECFAGGVLDGDGADIHVAMTSGSIPDEPALKAAVQESLTDVISELPSTPGWTCKAPAGDCSFAAFWALTHTNVASTYVAADQAKNMTPSLTRYATLFVYMSIPPFAFGGWAQAAADNWGADRVHIATEKPFGTGLDDADSLHAGIVAAVAESHLHLADHWVSFFMNKHLPTFRGFVQPRLLGSGANGALEWSEKDFERIVVTEYEERGLEGRGGFFDNVGQVRDMVQSHLLQVLALALVDPSAPSQSAAKLAIFNATFVERCVQAQYEGFLLEPKLGYHNASADSTLTTMTFHIDLDGWKSVEFVIATGKDMGTKPNQYTVELYQRNGSGLLTYEVGAEEVGVAGIKVKNWPLRDASAFEAPLPGFVGGNTFSATPKVDASGNGYILEYDVAHLYFPKPYAMMISSLVTASYSQAFLTYPECHRSWEIVTASQVAACLDPPPEAVEVYAPPSTCGNTPPEICPTGHTVKYMYDVTFACTAAHDAEYANVSLYQAKCHANGWRATRRVEHEADWRLRLPMD